MIETLLISNIDSQVNKKIMYHLHHLGISLNHLKIFKGQGILLVYLLALCHKGPTIHCTKNVFVGLSLLVCCCPHTLKVLSQRIFGMVMFVILYYKYCSFEEGLHVEFLSISNGGNEAKVQKK